ncbi:hypothetical protein GCM10022377_09980 [Zhihengliuella alba]|uniref:Uncharacterized protein n=1 Tax=Zhihengliuella alba TaxID=547018 RepID=A0ABP7D6E4_9MICC
MPTIEDRRTITQREVEQYLREDRNHSKRAARGIAWEALRDEAVARRHLPSGWADLLHPPANTFTRRHVDGYSDPTHNDVVRHLSAGRTSLPHLQKKRPETSHQEDPRAA